MRKFACITPILIALYSPLSMLAHNITEIQLSDSYRALIIAIMFALLSTAMLTWLFGDALKGALVGVGVIITIFSYGHIYQITKTINLMGFTIGRHRILFPVLTVVFVSYVIWIKQNHSPRTTVLQFLLATSIIALVYPTYTVLRYNLERPRHSPPKTDEVSITLESSSEHRLPDIYYIILDGYARRDVLKNYFNYDNTPFLSALEERGFFIADQSYANYAVTLMSIPSSMNMIYLNEFANTQAATSGYEEISLNELLQSSNARSFLKPYGYAMVAFETGYLITEVTSADYYLRSGSGLGSMSITQPINRFEAMLMDTTIYRLLRDTLSDRSLLKEEIIYPEYETHRKRIKFTFSSLADFAERTGNYFIFAHLVTPHPPFVFDEDGNSIPANTPFSMEDGNHYHGDIEDYLVLYPRQLAYINQLVLETIETILDHSDTPPIIIIQADHGSGVSMRWENVQPEALFERFSILNAYYFPDQEYGELYSSITPVNSFRLIFNQFFDANFEILEDRSFFFNPPDFLDLYEVTDLLE